MLFFAAVITLSFGGMIVANRMTLDCVFVRRVLGYSAALVLIAPLALMASL